MNAVSLIKALLINAACQNATAGWHALRYSEGRATVPSTLTHLQFC